MKRGCIYSAAGAQRNYRQGICGYCVTWRSNYGKENIMFCVIQEMNVKKSDKGGYAKELKSEYLSIIFNGEDIGHYWHFYGNERFERPVKKAYRISIHHSFRKNG